MDPTLIIINKYRLFFIKPVDPTSSLIQNTGYLLLKTSGSNFIIYTKSHLLLNQWIQTSSFMQNTGYLLLNQWIQAHHLCKI